MADKYEELAGGLNQFLHLLEKDNLENLNDGESGKESNHPELIDFDRLKKLLAEATQLCQTQAEAERELTAVKVWLTGRIKAYRKACQVTLQSGDAVVNIELESLSVSGLINQFENEGSRLRRTISTGNSHLLETKHRKRPDYRQFKS